MAITRINEPHLFLLSQVVVVGRVIASPFARPRRFGATLALALTVSIILAAAPVLAQTYDSQVEGELMTIEELSAYAEEHAPEMLGIQSLQAEVDAARVQAVPGNLNDPELGIGLGSTLGDGSFGLAGSISLTQQLEIHGEQDLRDRVANQLDEEVTLRIDSTRWDVHTQVHTHYVAAVADREVWELNLRLLQFIETVRDAVQLRVRAGQDAPLQLTLAEADVIRARQAVLEARSGYVRTLNELAAVVGWQGADLPIPATGTPSPEPAPDLESLFLRAQSERADLRVWEGFLVRLQAELELAGQESRVDPTIGVEYEFEVLGDFGEHRALVLFSIPLRSSGRQRTLEADAVREYERAVVLAEAARASVRAEIRTAYDAVQAAYERIRFFEEEVLPQWETNLSMLQRALEVGEIDLLGVLFAEERLIEQQVSAIEALRDYHTALAELERAIGAEVMP